MPSFQPLSVLSGNFCVDQLVHLAAQREAVDHHDHHQDQHRGGDQALHLRRRHASMTKIRPSAAGMNSPSTLRRESTMSRTYGASVPCRGAAVGLFAGHHLFAAVVHLGAAFDPLGLALLPAQLGPAEFLAARRASADGHRCGCDRSATAVGLRVWGWAGPWAPSCRAVPAPPRRTRPRRPTVVRSRVALLAAQQLHVCQVTSRAGCPACTSRLIGNECWPVRCGC